MRHVRRFLPLVLLLATACQVNVAVDRPVVSVNTGSAKPAKATPATPASEAPAASAAPTTAPKGLAPDPKKRLAGLTAAIFDSLPTRELARAQGVTTLLSNNGAGLISDKSGGLVSKIRTGALPNDGAGIVSNNGGSIVANNGGSVVGQNAANYALAQAPVIYKEIPSEDPPFQYFTTFYQPDFTGNIVGYLLPDFKARGRAAEEVERLVWDTLPFDLLDRESKGLFDARVHFPVRVERSRRMGVTKKIDLVIDMTIKAMDPVLLTAFQSMTLDFEMQVPLRAGGANALVLHAHDFVYPAGEGPGETPDGVYPIPVAFDAEGENAQGKLAVKASQPKVGQVTLGLASTYTRADGSAIRTTLQAFADGGSEERIVDEATGLEARLVFAPDGSGTGTLHDPAAGGAQIGALSWKQGGEGTITLDGAPSEAIRLY